MDVRMRVAAMIDAVRFGSVGGWAPWRVIHRPEVPVRLLVGGAMATLAVVLGLGWVAGPTGPVTASSPVPRTTGAPAGGGETADDQPKAAPGPAPAAGGAPPTLPPVETYGWLAADGSGPATWPCGPIRWRLVAEGAPREAEAFVAEAFDRVTAAAGGSINFTRDASIASWPTTFDDYAGVTVAWTANGWDGTAAGRGGASSRDGVLSDGVVRLRAGQWFSDTLTFTPEGIGPILLHEIGHVLNLDHVDQTVDSLMAPTATDRVDFTPTDRQALRYLGWAACA